VCVLGLEAGFKTSVCSKDGLRIVVFLRLSVSRASLSKASGLRPSGVVTSRYETCGW